MSAAETLMAGAVENQQKFFVLLNGAVAGPLTPSEIALSIAQRKFNKSIHIKLNESNKWVKFSNDFPDAYTLKLTCANYK